jgi:hypothetical protein
MPHVTSRPAGQPEGPPASFRVVGLGRFELPTFGPPDRVHCDHRLPTRSESPIFMRILGPVARRSTGEQSP